MTTWGRVGEGEHACKSEGYIVDDYVVVDAGRGNAARDLRSEHIEHPPIAIEQGTQFQRKAFLPDHRLQWELASGFRVRVRVGVLVMVRVRITAYRHS